MGQTMTPSPIIANSLIQTFIEYGLVPPLCTRILIDLKVGDVIRIHYSCFGSDQMESLLMALVQDGKLKSQTSIWNRIRTAIEKIKKLGDGPE